MAQNAWIGKIGLRAFKRMQVGATDSYAFDLENGGAGRGLRHGALLVFQPMGSDAGEYVHVLALVYIRNLSTRNKETSINRHRQILYKPLLFCPSIQNTMAQTFTTPITVQPEDIDQMGHVNNVV